MKKRCSLNEFRSYIRELEPSTVSYWAENQPWSAVTDPCKFQLSFPVVLISESPNMVVLKCRDGNEVWFNNVKYIDIDKDSTILGQIFHVICSEGGAEKSYALIAS